jgi:hypothetical protein
MVRAYANTVILGIIAALLLVIVLQQATDSRTDAILESVRAMDEGVADMRDQLAQIRTHVCVEVTPGADPQAQSGPCWEHQAPGSQ